VVTSDASMFADLVVGNRGNQVLIVDALNWLIGAEAFSGTTESEEDVRIEHTKEGQTSWFYLTVLAVPLAVVALGALRVQLRMRPRQGAAPRPRGVERSMPAEPKEEPTGKSVAVDDDGEPRADADEGSESEKNASDDEEGGDR
jgi:hypothetical protein